MSPSGVLQTLAAVGAQASWGLAADKGGWVGGMWPTLLWDGTLPAQKGSGACISAGILATQLWSSGRMCPERNGLPSQGLPLLF